MIVRVTDVMAELRKVYEGTSLRIKEGSEDPVAILMRQNAEIVNILGKVAVERDISVRAMAN